MRRPSATPTLSLLMLLACGACSATARPGSKEDTVVVAPPTVTGAQTDADAGSPADATTPTPDAGSAVDSAAPEPDAFADPPATPPAAGTCAPLARVAAVHETLLALSDADFVVLGGVTPDGLTVAWSTLVGGVAGFFVADRASRADAFGAPHAIASAEAAAAFGRIALDATGTRLVVASADRRGFRELSRAGRGAPFGPAAEGDFVDLNAAIAAMPDERHVGDPVLAQDGATFFYTVTGGIFEARVFEATRGATGFDAGEPHGELVTTPGARVAPTGLAADGNALFVYDTGTSTQKAVFRATPRAGGAVAPFTFTRPLGAVTAAQPSADCAQLFFAEVPPSGVGANLAVATFAP